MEEWWYGERVVVWWRSGGVVRVVVWWRSGGVVEEWWCGESCKTNKCKKTLKNQHTQAQNEKKTRKEQIHRYRDTQTQTHRHTKTQT